MGMVGWVMVDLVLYLVHSSGAELLEVDGVIPSVYITRKHILGRKSYSKRKLHKAKILHFAEKLLIPHSLLVLPVQLAVLAQSLLIMQVQFPERHSCKRERKERK